MRPEELIKAKLTKPHYEIWQELRGEFIYPLNTVEKNDYKSISKTKTFIPASSDREFVYSQLSKNIENACIKLRRHGLFTKEMFFFLKSQEFKYYGMELKLSRTVSVPQDILHVVSQHFNEVYKPKVMYRSTGIILMKLSNEDTATLDLFGQSVHTENIKAIYEEVDKMAKKFGKHSVFLGSSFKAMKNQ
ncbi:MAG: hypothetical protein M3Q63_02575 [bacterium]|nr:hypothetical protein [bacterium]